MLCYITMLNFSEKRFKIGNFMSILRELILLVTLASIFAIFMVTVLKIIRRAAFYRGKTAILIAGALSVLFLVALSYFLVGSGYTYHIAGTDSSIEAVSHSLLSGVALGVAAADVISQILLLAGKTPPDEKPEALANKSESPTNLKSPGRPKKQALGRKMVLPQSDRKENNEAKVSSTAETTRKKHGTS